MSIDPPDIIIPSKGAEISHAGTGVLVVTATNEKGVSDTITVPPGKVVVWYPPPGWRSVTFRAPGHTEEFRVIDQEASAQ